MLGGWGGDGPCAKHVTHESLNLGGVRVPEGCLNRFQGVCAKRSNILACLSPKIKDSRVLSVIRGGELLVWIMFKQRSCRVVHNCLEITVVPYINRGIALIYHIFKVAAFSVRGKYFCARQIQPSVEPVGCSRDPFAVPRELSRGVPIHRVPHLAVMCCARVIHVRRSARVSVRRGSWVGKNTGVP